MWVDDEQFDIDYHVRLTALPRPGDDGQLPRLCSAACSPFPLDRGPAAVGDVVRRRARRGPPPPLVIKSHHAMGDGIANVDLVLTLVDLEREPEPEPPLPRLAATSPTAPAPTACRDSVSRAAGPARPVWPGRRPRHCVNPAGCSTGRRFARRAGSVVPRGRTAGAVEPAGDRAPAVGRRRPLPLVRRPHASVKLAPGVTINDVVLEACTGALRRLPDRLRRGRARARSHASRRWCPCPGAGSDDEHGATLGKQGVAHRRRPARRRGRRRRPPQAAIHEQDRTSSRDPGWPTASRRMVHRGR